MRLAAAGALADELVFIADAEQELRTGAGRSEEGHQQVESDTILVVKHEPDPTGKISEAIRKKP